MRPANFLKPPKNQRQIPKTKQIAPKIRMTMFLVVSLFLTNPKIESRRKPAPKTIMRMEMQPIQSMDNPPGREGKKMTPMATRRRPWRPASVSKAPVEKRESPKKATPQTKRATEIVQLRRFVTLMMERERRIPRTIRMIGLTNLDAFMY